MRLLPFLLIACLASACRADRFDDFVSAKMKEQRIPGLAFAVVYKGNVVMSRGYGLADVNANRPVAKDTQFEIASVSKPILATAVMMLWERGKFQLTDPVGKYVAGLPETWARVPIKNLLSHTSGIREFRSFAGPRRMEETPFNDLVRAVPSDLAFEIGDHFAYSNTNYLLLGQLIASLSGSTYTEFLTENVFKPLGMTRTTFIGVSKEKALGYYGLSSGFAKASDCSLAWAGPGASIVSTAEDVARFDAALQTPKLLKPSTVALMMEPTSTRLGLMDYGLGWGVGKSGETKIAMHAGKMNGYASMYLRIPEQRIGIIVLTNAQEIDGNTIARGLLGCYFPEMAPLKLTPITDEDPELTKGHQAVLTRIVLGRPLHDEFTENYWAHVSQDKLKAAGAELGRGGRLRPLQVLSRVKQGSRDVHQYLATFGNTQLIVTFYVLENGKIDGLKFAAP